MPPAVRGCVCRTQAIAGLATFGRGGIWSADRCASLLRRCVPSRRMNRTSSKPLSVASPLLSHALEERVAEDAVRLSRPVKISNPCIEGFGIGDTGRNRGFANAFDHPRKPPPGKAVDQVGPAR